MASASEWEADLKHIVRLAEDAERGLSYLSACGSERARKQAGSYFTPGDVASFFWNEFFSISELGTRQAATTFVTGHRFVEPSAGAGALVFSLLRKCASLGMNPATLSLINLQIIDVNKQALTFVGDQFRWLSERWNVGFPNIKLICSDFRRVSFDSSGPPKLFFGNPPFVGNEKGRSKWKNIFADFSEIALRQSGQTGSVHFIVPLSLAFSRDYKLLRKIVFEYNRAITISHFDNIPDTLFKSGKPEHTNSNKANSQRCSILTVRPAKKLSIFSTQLQRWSKHDRERILSQSPIYKDVTSYSFDDQIPRPENDVIIQYLGRSRSCLRLRDLFAADGEYFLYISPTARNYIGFRENHAPGVHQLRFSKEDDFNRALLILSSDLFFSYWRTVGDGFHVTKSNIYEFPVTDTLIAFLNENRTAAQELWAARAAHMKRKLNSGRHIHSYDFSKHMPSLFYY